MAGLKPLSLTPARSWSALSAPLPCPPLLLLLLLRGGPACPRRSTRRSTEGNAAAKVRRRRKPRTNERLVLLGVSFGVVGDTLQDYGGQFEMKGTKLARTRLVDHGAPQKATSKRANNRVARAGCHSEYKTPHTLCSHRCGSKGASTSTVTSYQSHTTAKGLLSGETAEETATPRQLPPAGSHPRASPSADIGVKAQTCSALPQGL